MRDGAARSACSAAEHFAQDACGVVLTPLNGAVALIDKGVAASNLWCTSMAQTARSTLKTAKGGEFNLLNGFVTGFICTHCKAVRANSRP